MWNCNCVAPTRQSNALSLPLLSITEFCIFGPRALRFANAHFRQCRWAESPAVCPDVAPSEKRSLPFRCKFDPSNVLLRISDISLFPSPTRQLTPQSTGNSGISHKYLSWQTNFTPHFKALNSRFLEISPSIKCAGQAFKKTSLIFPAI